MIGVTLWQYLFRRYVVITCWFIIGILVIIYMIDFTEFAGRASGLPGYTLGLGALLSIMRLPSILLQTMPFIILFASISALLVLNRKYELVIARSAGISAWQFLLPMCAASLLIGLLMIMLVNPLSSVALAKVQELEFSIGMQGGTIGTFERPPWMRERTGERVTMIGAERVARGGSLLGDATFVRFDENGTIFERIDAATATLGDGQWLLNDAVRTVPGATSENVATLTINTNLRPDLVEESLAPPESISFFQLPRKIKVARTVGLGANAFAMQYQSLLALPFLLVAMTLIAATVSLKFVRSGQSGTVILAGILAGFLLYVVTVLARSFGAVGAVPPLTAAWLPVIVAFALGITVLLHREDG
ncbi:MAG: LPS export ABC transporter permease LptG [Pseudomonadota bacterium]